MARAGGAAAASGGEQPGAESIYKEGGVDGEQEVVNPSASAAPPMNYYPEPDLTKGINTSTSAEETDPIGSRNDYMATSVRERYLANARSLNKKIADDVRHRSDVGQAPPIKPFADAMAA